MLHPLFSTLVQRPDLVFDHVSAYGALISEEATQAGSDLVGRAIALTLLILSTILILGLAGAAVMLGFMLNQFHWVLVVVPGVALLLMIIAAVRAKRPLKGERFQVLKRQLDSDAQALRSVV